MARAKLRFSFSVATPSGIIASAIIPFEKSNLFELALSCFMAQSTKGIRHFPKPPPLGIIALAIILSVSKNEFC
jgi:hypothetical protein